MHDGYYWYFSGAGDAGDLLSEQPQVVEIYGDSLILIGSEYPYKVTDAHGRFVGPIEPPNTGIKPPTEGRSA